MPPKEKKSSSDTKNLAASSDTKSNCYVCSSEVKESDSAVGCDICEQWAHIKCELISEDEYAFLDSHKSVHWYCKACNKSVANVIKLVSKLSVRVEKLEVQIEKICTDVDSGKKSLEKLNEICSGKLPDHLNEAIDSKIAKAVAKLDSSLSTMSQNYDELKKQTSETETKLETAIEAKLVEKAVNTIKNDLQPTWASLVGKEVDIKFEQVSGDVTMVKTVLEDTKKKAEEERDRENRSHNIIIYRIPEAGTSEERAKADKSFCLQLLNEVLEVDAYENEFKLIRLGKRDLDTRPLMVQFREKTLKNRVMECLHKLKNADPKFKEISITHDFTASERAECKTLVAQAKQKQTEETGEYLWRVRGPPGQLKLVKLRKH